MEGAGKNIKKLHAYFCWKKISKKGKDDVWIQRAKKLKNSAMTDPSMKCIFFFHTNQMEK